MKPIQITVNVKLVQIDPNDTGREVRKKLDLPPSEQLVRVGRGRAAILADDEPVRDGSVLRSIPPVVQG